MIESVDTSGTIFAYVGITRRWKFTVIPMVVTTTFTFVGLVVFSWYTETTVFTGGRIADWCCTAVDCISVSSCNCHAFVAITSTYACVNIVGTVGGYFTVGVGKNPVIVRRGSSVNTRFLSLGTLDSPRNDPVKVPYTSFSVS